MNTLAAIQLFERGALLEAIGTYIANKPPASWNDLDKAHFEMNLSELARKFHRFEVLSFERQQQSEQTG